MKPFWNETIDFKNNYKRQCHLKRKGNSYQTDMNRFLCRTDDSQNDSTVCISENIKCFLIVTHNYIIKNRHCLEVNNWYFDRFEMRRRSHGVSKCPQATHLTLIRVRASAKGLNV